MSFINCFHFHVDLVCVHKKYFKRIFLTDGFKVIHTHFRTINYIIILLFKNYVHFTLSVNINGPCCIVSLPASQSGTVGSTVRGSNPKGTSSLLPGEELDIELSFVSSCPSHLTRVRNQTVTLKKGELLKGIEHRCLGRNVLKI